jgi:hypothetical protein
VNALASVPSEAMEAAPVDHPAAEFAPTAIGNSGIAQFQIDSCMQLTALALTALPCHHPNALQFHILQFMHTSASGVVITGQRLPMLSFAWVFSLGPSPASSGRKWLLTRFVAQQ